MIQIIEDYVSFGTAKLLKEKGFDEDIARVVNEEGEIDYLGSFQPSLAYLHYTWYRCPTLQMAMKWLREVHHCVVCITPLTFHCDGIVSKWGYCIWADDNTEVDEDDTPEFDTYEEACEAAIKYCLENLI